MLRFLMHETATAGEMQSRRVHILVLVCLCALTGTAGVAAGGMAEDPLADAGLDQTVTQGTTVYLDAGGSVSPEGEIGGFAWEIERPDGTTTTPACRSCERTRFQPTQPGVYNATVTVTDDEGRSATDTLRVTVTESEPPAVTLSGPEIVLVNDTPTINLTATAGDEPLSSLTWLVDGQQSDAKFVDGNRTTDSITLSPTEPGKVVIEARVTDERGRSATAEHTLTVEDGQFGVRNDTLVTESGKYDLDSIAIRFTGSATGYNMDEMGNKWVYEGNKFGYTVGFQTYLESSGEVLKRQPFSQATATFPHLPQNANPHSYYISSSPNARVLDKTTNGGTLRATSPGYAKVNIDHRDDSIPTITGYSVKVKKKQEGNERGGNDCGGNDETDGGSDNNIGNEENNGGDDDSGSDDDGSNGSICGPLGLLCDGDTGSSGEDDRDDNCAVLDPLCYLGDGVRALDSART
jgi:hypothetical protein